MLNVWKRGLSDGGQRPVMFWHHCAGGFAASSGLPLDLTQRGDVVVMTINHPLGALGYSYLAGGRRHGWNSPKTRMIRLSR